MSIIHVNQIGSKVKALFADKIDNSDLNHKDKEIQTKILTRCLSAYAVFCIGDTSIDEAASAVVDGADDNGIDAIHYSPSSKRMIIVQSKWKKDGTGEPDNGDLRKFKDGVLDLINLELDKFNNKVNLKKQMIETALGEFDTKFDLVLIHTGANTLSKHNQQVMDSILNELNDAGDGTSEDVVSFHHLNQAIIHSGLASGMDGEPIDLEIGLSQWGKIEEPHQGFFGIVAGEEVANWWLKKGKRLFAKNIRQMLGAAEVNDEVKRTIEEQPENFWYYNNGITIVAESIKKSMVGGNSRDIGSFKASNISIVNGAQTVSVIGKYSQEGGANLAKLRLPIRLISLEGAPEDFGANVTKTNNRQNRIESRDFVSLDDEQIRLKRELSLEGIEYNIVRSENVKTSASIIDLSEATIALACASTQVGLAVQAKREIGRFYDNLNKAPYKTNFNPQTNGIYLRNTVFALRKIDEIIGEMIANIPKKSGKEYGVLVHGNRMLAFLVFRKLVIHKIANNFDFDMSSIDWYETTSDMLEKLMSEIEENYKDKFLATLFKNASICKAISEKI
ncbi:AIPR family protein [Escherichia coli]|nr:AIPR family protein [Escherichia coli]EKH4352951.1 AIPR family protein [Escherichia coli]EKJ1106563.1 AIPR family protein [Escherichia coli]EKP2960178.1 AIPR family protein [Escherichia coli]EKP2969301.1 AIPR family protein [Escherichia coli]